MEYGSGMNEGDAGRIGMMPSPENVRIQDEKCR